jgi:uncharacterized protein (TIRG00374 family)
MAPTIVGERASGVLGCFLVWLSAMLMESEYEYVQHIAFITIASILIMLYGIKKFSKCRAIGGRLKKMPFAAKRLEMLKKLYWGTVRIFGLKIFIGCVALSYGYWVMECTVFYLIIHSFNIEIGFAKSAFILTAASIGGGLSLMPGSIGVLEGGMIGMLAMEGISLSLAGEITLLHRFLAMWDVVIIGAGVLMGNLKKFKLT